MKVTILVCTYNRPQYLKRCLDSLQRSNLNGAEIVIVDDASTDEETLKLIMGYKLLRSSKNCGIKDSLSLGVEMCFFQGADIVINLDSDAIIRNDFISVLLNLHKKFPDKIITGFHSTTKNKDGSDRHKIISEGKGYAEKLSIGGINMLFTQDTWEKYAKPQMLKIGNWDHMTSLAAGSVICAVPSLVEHIGVNSAMGHTGDVPDIAADFKPLHLPNVTLVCIDDNLDRCRNAIHESLKNIQFRQFVLLTSKTIQERDWFRHEIEIPKLGSKEAYSNFILNELHRYINTDYALIIQYDGYVKNAEAWDNDFLKYDYIGAPWHYTDGMNVGNGGFSLRSKKLLELTAKMRFPITHPEDHVICRTYRKQLEQQGITFAPEPLAKKFSFEGYMQPGTYTNEFGFHGGRAFLTPPKKGMEGFIINQFLGLGDILFLVPLVRKWLGEGHDVIWPIADEYFELKEYFKDIQFVKKSSFPMNYEMRTEFMHRFLWGVYRVIPLRWNRALKMQDAMITKYRMYGEDFNMWRALKWERDYEKEKKLAELVGAKGNYAFAARTFGNITDGGATERDYKDMANWNDIPLIKCIELQRIEGFTILDWAGIIENAIEIHAVSSSTLYLFEVLNLKCKEINLYSRKLGQRDFDYVEPLLTKKYKFHL